VRRTGRASSVGPELDIQHKHARLEVDRGLDFGAVLRLADHLDTSLPAKATHARSPVGPSPISHDNGNG
jgi:hypothetical protein